MTDKEAVAILLERRGTMYDPAIVDTFVRARHQIMPPPEAAAHPLTRTLGGARELIADPMDAVPSPPADAAATSEVLAVASLARAVSGEASLADVGALTWMMLRQVVPCVSMGLFLYDDQHDAVSAQFAAGAHAAVVHGKRLAVGSGVAGWCAANRRLVRNADPAIDLGVAVTTDVTAVALVDNRPADTRRRDDRCRVVLRVHAGRLHRRSRPPADASGLEPRLVYCLAAENRSAGRRRARSPAAPPAGELRLLKR